MKLIPLLTLLSGQLAFSAEGVTVLWNYHPDYRDVLEYQTELGGCWTEVPSPYPLSDDGLDYKIAVPFGCQPQKFFRVSRTCGKPLTIPSNALRSSAP